jgi:hypothetical protein
MTLDFQTNKRVCEEVAIIPSKSLKNKVAGYATVRLPATSCAGRSACGAIFAAVCALGCQRGVGDRAAARALAARLISH